MLGFSQHGILIQNGELICLLYERADFTPVLKVETDQNTMEGAIYAILE